MHQLLKKGVVQYISDIMHVTMLVILSEKIAVNNEKLLMDKRRLDWTTLSNIQIWFYRF